MRRTGTPAGVKKRAKELRQEMTPAETVLWEKLRDRRLGGYKFRRQKAIGPFIADFYCAERRLVVEIDGDIHDLKADQDMARTEQFTDYGYRVIRFRNEQVTRQIESVLTAILANCQNRAPLLPALGEGAGDEGDSSINEL
jgi:very-short-patch-repair endonuclease